MRDDNPWWPRIGVLLVLLSGCISLGVIVWLAT